MIFHRFVRPLARLLVALSMLIFAGAPFSAPPTQAQGQAIGRLNRAFQQAAREFAVPRDLLIAIAFAETHFDDHDGKPSIDNGYGVMHLVENPQAHTLGRAAALLGLSEKALQTDTAQNIRGGAALLRAYADEAGLNGPDLAAWYPVVARYSNAADLSVGRFYADEVYRLLNAGVSGQSKGGETVLMPAREVHPQRGKYEGIISIQSTDYGPAIWTPASSSNYTVANRPSDYPINYVIIHVTEGSYASAISWFQNPSAQVSAHYVIRSSDGQITQMVREKDIAWHAGNWDYNTRAIGIEHEGFVDDGSWFTDAMYRASAALTRNICDKYGIPKDRTHIIGHVEVPGSTHTDPGPYWNWTYYMQLVTQTAWSSVVDNTTSGRFTASSNWLTSSWSSQRYGADYRYASPQAISDAAWFKFNIPATANYEVFVWYPATSGYNASTPFAITTSSGTQFVYVNQQVNGGQWNSLGTFSLNAGDYNVVGVSRWTSGSGYVIADAVKLVQR